MKTNKLFLVLAIVALISSDVFAQYGNGPRNGRGQEENPGFANGLDLTESQQNQMQSLRLTLQKEILPLRNTLGENRAKMRTLSTAENADLKAINKLIDENSGLQAQIAKLMASHQQDVRKLLTEEQRIKFDMRSHQHGYGQGHGQGYGRGQHQNGEKPMMRGQGRQ